MLLRMIMSTFQATPKVRLAAHASSLTTAMPPPSSPGLHADLLDPVTLHEEAAAPGPVLSYRPN